MTSRGLGGLCATEGSWESPGPGGICCSRPSAQQVLTQEQQIASFPEQEEPGRVCRTTHFVALGKPQPHLGLCLPSHKMRRLQALPCLRGCRGISWNRGAPQQHPWPTFRASRWARPSSAPHDPSQQEDHLHYSRGPERRGHLPKVTQLKQVVPPFEHPFTHHPTAGPCRCCDFRGPSQEHRCHRSKCKQLAHIVGNLVTLVQLISLNSCLLPPAPRPRWGLRNARVVTGNQLTACDAEG